MAEFNILDPMGLFNGAQLTGVPAETLGEFPDELAEPTEEMLSRPDVLKDILGDDEILDAFEEKDPEVLDNVIDMLDEDEEGVLGTEVDDADVEYLGEMLDILADEAPGELNTLKAEFPDILGGVDSEDELSVWSRAKAAGRRAKAAVRRARAKSKASASRVKARIKAAARRAKAKVSAVSHRAKARATAAARKRIAQARRVKARVGAYVRTKAKQAGTYVANKVAEKIVKQVTPPGIPAIPTPAGMPAIPTPPGMPAIPTPPGMPAIPGMPAMPTPPAGMPAIPGMPAMPTPPKMPVFKFPFPLPPGMELRDVPAPPGAPKVQVPVPVGAPALPAPPAMPGAPALGGEDEDEYLEETLDLPEVSETLTDDERVARGMLAGKEVSHEEIPIGTLIVEKPIVTEAAELLAEPPEEELLGMGLI